MKQNKPIRAQQYAARARQQWALGNREQAEAIWLRAKAEWYRWAYCQQL